MPQNECIPQAYEVNENSKDLPHPIISLDSVCSKSSPEKASFSFEAIHDRLFRITYTSKNHPLPPYPSCLQPKRSDNFNPSKSESGSKNLQVACKDITVSVRWEDVPAVSLSWTGDATPFYHDLSFRSYGFDSDGVVHYTNYNEKAIHVGLGEKAAPMDLSHRHFIISASDCFGYDNHHTDPLYKHIPLLVTLTQTSCVGIFSTSHSRGTWSLGSEIDGLWGRYKVYRQDYGGLEEYVMVGKTLAEVVHLYAELVGFPKLIPRWALGYIAGGMKYTMMDEPRACDALLDFAAKLQEHDIPCSAFQMSSGYTVAETEPKTRNVFTWNRHRFPDPIAFISQFHERGIRLLANVKPYVLKSHPSYKELASKNAFFTDSRTEETAIARLWSAGGGESGEGGHIDFTSTSGSQWWYEGVLKLREYGIDGIWNDNNEYTIADDNWKCALDGADSTYRSVGMIGRAFQAELMAKSSHDAYIDSNPEIRPFVLTRSATAGTMRYAASSWGGDNVTSWDSMKGSISLSLNAGISLLQCYGHDIGGFEGPQPSPELLLRWVQLGIYSPRFAINCFKTSAEDNLVGDVIEPWMYPETTSHIRKALKRRYELIPYLYSLSLESHMFARPPQRWIGWGYESDSVVWEDELKREDKQYWLGDTLLISGVFKPGGKSANMYLPRSGHHSHEGYLNLNEPYGSHDAGQWISVETEWTSSIPVFAKIGGAIPIGVEQPTYAPGGHDYTSQMLCVDSYRALEIFPPHGSSNGESFTSTWYEDDGISRDPNISSFSITYSSTEEAVVVDVRESANNLHEPLWKLEDIVIILPVGDHRRVASEAGAEFSLLKTDISGRLYFSRETRP